MIHKEGKREYQKSVQDGTWQEGIFIFVTGEVVVRFNRPAFHVEQEFPAGSISVVKANENIKILYIFWTDASNHKMTFNVDCSRMIDNPDKIAFEMNKLLHLEVPREETV